MSKTFLTMKTNVGNNVQDTSSAMATIIGVYLNDKYLDIARSVNWSALIDWDYTFVTVASTQTYSFPTSFEEEIFCANITDGSLLERYSEGKWWNERYGAYSAASIPSGTPVRYLINHDASKIVLDPTPNVVKTIAFPYKKSPTALSVDSDTVVIKDIEFVMELGATGEAWAYKKQFQKADYYLGRYELEKMKRIGQERSQINQRYQFISDTFRGQYPRPLTGDLSYNDL